MKGPKANDRRFPLPRRIGHGDFPHPALARVVYSRKHSQRHQAHVLQMSIKANALPRPPATLTTTLQVFAQPMPHEVVQVAERLSRIAQLEVVGPPSQMSIHSPNQLRQWCMALVRTEELPQRLPLSPALWVRLHDFRPIITINSSQLTRTNQACLALSEFHELTRRGKELSQRHEVKKMKTDRPSLRGLKSSERPPKKPAVYATEHWFRSKPPPDMWVMTSPKARALLCLFFAAKANQTGEGGEAK